MTAYPSVTFSNSGFGVELGFYQEVDEGWPTIQEQPGAVTSTNRALFAQVNSGEPLPSPWRQGRSDLADAYMRIGYRWRMWLSAECHAQRLLKGGIGKSIKPRTGPMSNKEVARRETPEDTLNCTFSECTGNPSSAAVTLPDCNCGSVGSRRLRMINRAVIQTSSHNR